jgi:hypothetical protein
MRRALGLTVVLWGPALTPFIPATLCLDVVKDAETICTVCIQNGVTVAEVCRPRPATPPR